MQAAVSTCGIYDCGSCEHRAAGECPGCGSGNMRLVEVGQRPCGVYACVTSHGLQTCSDCPEDSCHLKRSVETICPLRSRFRSQRWWAGHMSRALESRNRAHLQEAAGAKVSDRVVTRLRMYLSALDSLAASGAESVSSWQLAEKVGVNAALIRKDLSRFGDFGTPSFGYRVDFLSKRIRSILRLDEPRGIVWIGAACYRLHSGAAAKLAKHGCRVVGVFDPDPEEVGAAAGDHLVRPVEAVRAFVEEHGARLAAISVSGPDAQAFAEELVSAGVRGILNLSGELLVLPGHVHVSNFDVAGELLELSYYL